MSATSCHQCHLKGKELVPQCSNCHTQYCTSCADNWYSKSKGVLFMEACPHCLKFCNCGACLQKGQSQIQELNTNHEEKANLLAYIINVLLPSLKKQTEEAETQDNKVLELIVRAEAIVRLHESTNEIKALQTSCSCSTRDAGSKNFCKAASRDSGAENYLYSIMAADIEKYDPHFLAHFSNGQPVIVHGLMTGLFDLSWEPRVMERAFRSVLLKSSNSMDLSVINCASWCEEKIKISDFFKGYSEGILDYHGNPKVLKLEWHPLDMFQKHLPRHYEELSRCLPFKHYTHPMSGYLSDVSVCVSYGPHGGGDQWGSIMELQFGMSDRVSTLVDVTSISCMLDKGKSSMSSNTPQGLEAGAEWDIFRREDVPKLEDYLSKHAEEAGRPNHQRKVYLTREHKMKLKDEYGIEPWTILQKLGDAIFVPAGCFYQMKNLQSCIHVAVDFFMAKSLSESGKFFEGRRSVVPRDFQIKYNLKVKELTLKAVDQAVEGWEKIPCGLGENTPSLGFLTRKTGMMKLSLEREGHKFSPATRTMLDNEINSLFM